MTEMMDMVNAMAKEKETVKPKDKTIEGQSGEFEGKGFAREQVPASKYNVENPFVIRVNKSKGGTSESSSRKTKTNLTEVREEKNMKGYVSLPLKYVELLPMLIDNNLVTPVQSVPKKPPFPKGYDFCTRCDYHLGSSGHTTENCGSLRNKVREFIEMGKAKHEIQKRDEDIKIALTQAREVALQVADLADATMPLSQNLNPALDNERKLTRLLDEVENLGSRAHRYL
ncbi:hypothetical protein V6N11_049940 [Hibiscus sabdariffa]|uniref:Uncharacterized protein n=1 Tax=Hibiscus sabdariffa TaxID=183260 RepID=A0ABR2T8U6_9ROSI